jgi:hypothetical protein
MRLTTTCLWLWLALAPAAAQAPVPPVAPAPAPAAAPAVYVTLVLDYDRMTPGQAAVAGSPALRRALAAGGCSLRLYPAGDPALDRRRLTRWVARAGGPPALLVQDSWGQVKTAERLRDEAGVLAAVGRVRRK